jgi:hypothetical protein
MNDQFVKTLEALESAKNEMSELWNTLEGLEIRMEANWHECEIARSHKVRLEMMIRDIRYMLHKREKVLLEGVLAASVAAQKEKQ